MQLQHPASYCIALHVWYRFSTHRQVLDLAKRVCNMAPCAGKHDEPPPYDVLQGNVAVLAQLVSTVSDQDFSNWRDFAFLHAASGG